MAAQFQIVLRAGPDAGKLYPLKGKEITIGRDTGNTISINDAEVSRKHAKLVVQESGYVIEDMGSTNGTFVNGQRVSTPLLLRGGEVIALGEGVVLLFEEAADPNATMVSSRTAAPAKPQPRPAAKPAPPQQAYAGQVPAGPDSPVVQSPKKKLNPWLLVAIIAAGLICVCAVGWLIVDQLNLYCTFFPFLFPGAC